MPNRPGFYVPSTHWDREWYQSFQDYRYRLVQLLDGLLAAFAAGRMQGPFHLDGQTILLDDYLEVRPEHGDRVRDLVRAGRLTLGPWYVMPDEFCVGGESLIRNLQLGAARARHHGTAPSQAGYVCDTFGHISQLPQLFAGFGVRAVFLFRGTNALGANFRWRGADGTELPGYRFAREGYGAFVIQTGTPRHYTATFDSADVGRRTEAFVAAEAARTDIDAVLILDGCDHLEPDYERLPLLPVGPQRATGGVELTHASLDAYVDALVAQAGRIPALLEGELREPALYPADVDQQWLIPGVLSSRVSLKQANRRCETLLTRWAEPFGALAHRLLQREYPRGFLDVAWRWLLQNHPHDSIDGCSIDAVHRDMHFRFAQAEQIAQRLATEALRAIGTAVPGTPTAQELRVVIANPEPRDRREVVELMLDIPAEFPVFQEWFGYEPKPAFRLFDAAGTELPYQRLSQTPDRTRFRMHAAKLTQSYRVHVVSVAVELALPALGYTTLTVRPGRPGEPTRYPTVPSLVTDERSMANDELTVRVESNGTLTLTDRRTDATLMGLLTFEDAADIGDGWFHGQAVNDQVFVSSAAAADVALIHDGPLQATFRIRTVLRIPHRYDFKDTVRAPIFTDLPIETSVTLRRGQPFVDCVTTVHNTAEDHRLRVLFPSHVAAGSYQADGAFDVLDRRIALRADNHRYRELEVETRPQQTWTAVQAGAAGLAVVSDGLLESTVRDRANRPIALTLLRATRRTVFTDGEPDGQERGPHHFHYRLVPLGDTIDPVALCRYGQELGAGLRTVQLREDDFLERRPARELPPTGSLLNVEGPVIATAVGMVDGELEVRAFNPRAHPVAASLTVPRRADAAPAATWRKVRLDGTPLTAPAPLRDGAVTVDFKPKEIVTLRLRVKDEA